MRRHSMLDDVPMRTTIALDDHLLERAREYAGIQETAPLLRHVLKKFVEREAARRLAAMGGTEPDIKAPPRRRFPSE